MVYWIFLWPPPTRIHLPVYMGNNRLILQSPHSSRLLCRYRECYGNAEIKMYRNSCEQADKTSHRVHSLCDILQTTFSNSFSSMKMYEFRLNFHWSLFLAVKLTIFQHCFIWLFGALSAPSHYLLQTHICVTQPQRVNPSGAETRIFKEKLCQYHGCWCPGFLHCQAISNHNNDCVG